MNFSGACAPPQRQDNSLRAAGALSVVVALSLSSCLYPPPPPFAQAPFMAPAPTGPMLRRCWSRDKLDSRSRMGASTSTTARPVRSLAATGSHHRRHIRARHRIGPAIAGASARGSKCCSPRLRGDPPLRALRRPTASPRAGGRVSRSTKRRYGSEKLGRRAARVRMPARARSSMPAPTSGRRRPRPRTRCATPGAEPDQEGNQWYVRDKASARRAAGTRGISVEPCLEGRAATSGGGAHGQRPLRQYAQSDIDTGRGVRCMAGRSCNSAMPGYNSGRRQERSEPS